MTICLHIFCQVMHYTVLSSHIDSTIMNSPQTLINFYVKPQMFNDFIENYVIFCPLGFECEQVIKCKVIQRVKRLRVVHKRIAKTCLKRLL